MRNGRPLPLLLRLAYALCILLIIAASVAIVWRLSQGRRGEPETEGVSREGVASLMTNNLSVDETHSLRLADLEAEFVVVFLFSPADCAACLPELTDLDRLARERKDLAVVAVMGFSNPSEAKQTHENFGLNLPIVQDADGALIQALKPPRTPWKLLIRRSDQRVLLESPPTVSQDERQAFVAELRRVLGKGSPPADAV